MRAARVAGIPHPPRFVIEVGPYQLSRRTAPRVQSLLIADDGSSYGRMADMGSWSGARASGAVVLTVAAERRVLLDSRRITAPPRTAAVGQQRTLALRKQVAPDAIPRLALVQGFCRILRSFHARRKRCTLSRGQADCLD